MTDSHIVVFQAKPRYLLKSAIVPAVMVTAALTAGLWRSSTHTSWQKALAVLASVFASCLVVYWGTHVLLARRHRVTVLPSGLQAPTTAGHQAFCAWENITEANVIRGAQAEFLLLKGRYLAIPLRLPLELLEDADFVASIDRHVPEGTPLSLALRSAGA